MESCNMWLFLYYRTEVAVSVQRVNKRLQVPGIECASKLSLELGHRWMLIRLFIMKMVEQSRCNIVRDDDSVFKLTWSVGDAVSRSNEQTVWSKFGVSDIATHLIMLVPRFIMRNLAGCEMRDRSFTGVRVLLSSFPGLTIGEGDVHVE